MAGSRDRYSNVAVGLHWLIAALIVTNILVAWTFDSIPGPLRRPRVEVHATIGLTILALSILRLGWRLAAAPRPSSDLKPWERIASGIVHGLFYVVMIVMPLTGWAVVSTHAGGTTGVSLFHVAPLPPLGGLGAVDPAAAKSAHRAAAGAHGLLAKLAYLLLLLHVGAALKHQFIDRDGVVSRMAPWMRGRARAA